MLFHKACVKVVSGSICMYYRILEPGVGSEVNGTVQDSGFEMAN